MRNEKLDVHASRLSELIAARLGLHFPPERKTDLMRGLAAAASEFGLADAAACADWLLSASLTREELHALATHLTVGETYFFRERKAFEALAMQVIPQLIERRGAERRLRVWSAGCCSGEEAYSLAILLQQCIPDCHDWQISILATDVNERSLRKAAAGIYTEWSFRDAAPGFKESYFRRTADGRYALHSQFKQSVKFAPLNLVDDSFPSLATDTVAMDLILCRNVLMYFTPTQARKVAGNLRRALRDDGWLLTSAGDGSHALTDDFTPVSMAGAILYRKKNVAESTSSSTESVLVSSLEPPVSSRELSIFVSSDTPLEIETLPSVEAQAGSHSQRARALANKGKLEEALHWCDRWVEGDASDAAARYLRAMVLQELGRAAEARRSLQHALYLYPQLVLAHFALGNLARTGGQHQDARRHFNNALELLRGCAPEELLPESDGLTAGRLREILTTLLALEVVA
jgi:chemotaxis protein methyltransferase CheR